MWPELTTKALARSNRQHTNSFVYFVIDEHKRVKIGKAADPKRRLKMLQSGCADKLEIVGVLAGGRPLEAELHKLFADSRQRGEWFELTPKLRDLILDAAKAGSRKDDPVIAGDDSPVASLTGKQLDEFAAVMGLERGVAAKYAKRLIEEAALRENAA